MPPNPNLTGYLEKLYQAAEKEILERLNKALLKPEDRDYLEAMVENIGEILDGLRMGNMEWCTKAIPQIYGRGVIAADAMVQHTHHHVTGGFGAIHQQAAEVLAENTYGRLEDVVDFIGRRVDDIYRNLALEVIRGSVVGYETWLKTAMKYKEKLAEEGVTGFIDKAGREWNMERYASMVARTSTMECHLQGTVNRLLENDFDLVQVSSHMNPCELCAPWEGQVLSLTGRTMGYPTLDYAKEAGLFHPNCKHAIGLYLDVDTETADMEKELEGKELKGKESEGGSSWDINELMAPGL